MPNLIDVPGLGTPAAIFHDNCQEVLVDPEIWYGLDPGQQGFILEHEAAHCQHDIKDEFKADRIGAINYLKKGGDAADIRSAMAHSRSPKRIKRMNRFLSQYKPMSHFSQAPQLSRFGPSTEDLLEESADQLTQAREASQNRGFQVDDDFLLDVIEILGDTAGNIWGSPSPVPGSPPIREDNSSTLLLIGGIAIAMFLVIIIAIKK